MAPSPETVIDNPAGFIVSVIVSNYEEVWGYGATQEAAWAGFHARAERSDCAVSSDGEDDEPGYYIIPATAALLAELDAGSLKPWWIAIRGVAVTHAEFCELKRLKRHTD